MSSALVLASTSNTSPSRPLATIVGNLDDFVVRIPADKVVKYVRLTNVDQVVSHTATKCLELEPEQLYEIKTSQGHCMSGTTSKALKYGFQWLADRPELFECLCVVTIDEVSDVFLRACTPPPMDSENKKEQKAYELDQMIMWRLNAETLRLIKPGVLSKEECPYEGVHSKHAVYTYFKKTKEVEVDGSVGGHNKTYLEADYPRLLEFDGSKPKTVNSSMAASKKALDTKLDKEYEATQMPTDKLLRGHFNLLNNVVGVKRGVGDVLCFEVMNSNQVETTRLGDRTILMITPNHDVTATAPATSMAVDDD